MTTPAKPDRLPFFDAMRYVAAMGVLWIHTVRAPSLEWTRDVGRFAVPLFTLGAILFVFEHVRRKPGDPFAAYLRSRVLRLYVPFLVWGAIYLAARYVKHVVLHVGMDIRLTPAALLFTGPAQQLWFLPFLLVVSVIAFGVAKVVIAKPRLARPLAVVGAIIGLALCAIHQPWHGGGDLRDTFGYWWAAAPAVPLGISLATLNTAEGTVVFHRRWILVLAVCLLAMAEIHLLKEGRAQLPEHLAGVSLLLIALYGVDGPVIRAAARLGPYAFGVYLIHVLPMETFAAVAFHHGAKATAELDVATFAFALIVSTVVTAILARFRATRLLV